MAAVRAWSLLLAFCVVGMVAMLREAEFFRSRDMDGYLGEDHFYHSTAKSRSRLQCSGACGKDASCYAFTYVESSRQCFLYNTQAVQPRDPLPGASTHCRQLRPCPSDWELLNQTFCVRLSSDWASWDGALERCGSLGGQLISLETQTKVEAVTGYLNNRTSQTVWLGASNRNEEAQWRWAASGDPAVIPWGASEPNNQNNSEHCLIYWNAPPKMNDYVCSRGAQYLCEVSLF